MLKVLTAAQMREVDRLTTERYGIPSILLMENAAHAVARVITEKLGGSVKGKSILILCGPGNNGGDGAALARILVQAEAIVDLYFFSRIVDYRGDARVNVEALKQLNTARYWEEVPSIDAWSGTPGLDYHLDRYSAIVDALFGTGLTRSLDPAFTDVFETVKESPALKVAVDVPSGVGENMYSSDPRLSADLTVTFTAPKPVNVVPGKSEFNGLLVVTSIGSPQQLIDEQPSQLYLAEQSDAAEWLLKSEFTKASYKNKRGHALIVGGSRNYSGAAVLAGNAAIRSGVGLVTVATPDDSREGVIARVSPEVMVRGISQTPEGSAAEKAADEVNEFLKNVDAVAIGSGLSSKEDETKAFIRRIVEERQTPVVIDADGLTALSPWATKGLQKPARSKGTRGDSEAQDQPLPLILTPHEGEFKKLLGVEGDEANEVLRDRVQAVRNFATNHDVILVLKGERALIGAPDGRVVVNPTGNSGLGKAGNGDTLTGIIAGFVAQAVQMNIDMFETVVAAVYIAGMAGDVAEKKYGKRVMTASDVRDCLVEVFEELSNAEN